MNKTLNWLGWRTATGLLATMLALSAPFSAADPESVDRRAFSHPSVEVSNSQTLDFTVGRGFFRRLWVSSPASTQAADGLGPLYNARSCAACHPNNGRGFPPRDGTEKAHSLLLKLDIPAQHPAQQAALQSGQLHNIPEPNYGLQLQNFATSGQTAEGHIALEYSSTEVELNGGERVTLRKPHYRVAELGYGELHPQTRLSPRVAPQLIGMGLLESIPESFLHGLADPDDQNGDGISGRVNRVWSRAEQRFKAGRFGYKAVAPSVNEQVQSAFATDIGISTPLYPEGWGDCTEQQTTCRNAPHGNSPQFDDLEAHQQVMDLVNLYVANLSVPAPRRNNNSDREAGEILFAEIGCGQCHIAHTPSLLRAEGIAPYTDLLLHDMGEGLADHRPEGMATGQEWRTAPLWGIGLTEAVSGYASYLHDGRARTVLEAILWHGGEAQQARDRVVALSPVERQQLLTFIESL